MADVKASSNDILYVITSAPKSRPWYRRDFLNCLCYPSGSRTRFSYAAHWINPDALHSKPGQRLLVCFREADDKNGHQLPRPRFTPIRWGHLVGFSRGGPVADSVGKDEIYWGIDFELGSFFSVQPAAAKSALPRSQQEIRERSWLVASDIQRSHFGTDPYFVFLGAPPTEDPGSDERLSWVALTEQLSDEPSLSECSFFRVSSFAKVRRGKPRGRFPQEVRPQLGPEGSVTYVLKSNSSYRLELEHFLDLKQANPDKDLSISASTDSVTVTAPVRSYLGPQAQSAYQLSCVPLYSRQTATLVLEEPSDQAAHYPRAEFWLHLKPNYWTLPVVALLVAGGSLSTLVTAGDITTVFGSSNWIGQNAAAVADGIRLIAAVLTGVGAYLGFRTIPQ